MDEKRIYVVVAETIQVPFVPDSHAPPLRTVVQPEGRQIAQACHVVSMLRQQMIRPGKHFSVLSTSELIFLADKVSSFVPFTTIILQARDSAEVGHVYALLYKDRLKPVIFSDDNPDYGPGSWPTAIAVLATKKQVMYALDYLPLWGSK